MTRQLEVFEGESELADAAAALIADAVRGAVAARNRCALALSGGKSPAPMFRRLAAEEIPWDAVDVLQVDERAVPDGHPDRNMTLIHSELLEPLGARAPRMRPMPVTHPSLEEAAEAYAAEVEDACGSPPVPDVVHLGLGADGHTASLVEGDPVTDIDDRWVAVTNPYQGYRRLTLTYPVLNAAGVTVFHVAGADRAAALERVLDGDPAMPAARVTGPSVFFMADEAAASALPRR